MGKATRDAYGETLKRLGSTHPDIVVLDADLSESTKTSIFAKKFPDRFFDTGIAEENMIGIAAGLATTVRRPGPDHRTACVESRSDAAPQGARCRRPEMARTRPGWRRPE